MAQCSRKLAHTYEDMKNEGIREMPFFATPELHPAAPGEQQIIEDALAEQDREEMERLAEEELLLERREQAYWLMINTRPVGDVFLYPVGAPEPHRAVWRIEEVIPANEWSDGFDRDSRCHGFVYQGHFEWLLEFYVPGIDSVKIPVLDADLEKISNVVKVFLDL